ncbi:MAG: 23S rRNA (uracil-C(5))-methyltransferase RlmCD [Calditrichaeota bacterium]|nr:23S rRNA (uracil-C(5))-methyltransferase RlmCD [Calditrichota bacterium]
MALEIPEQLLARDTTPRCPHFGDCGGCAMQDVPYEAQVRAKAETVSRMLGRDVEITPSPDPYGYRHRMDYVVAFGKLGLRMRGRGDQVVDLHECHLVRPRVSALLPMVHAWLDEFGIRGFNLVTKRGDLRYITFRHAFSSDQLMAILVTASRDTAVEPLAQRLADHVDSVVWSVQPRVGDDSHGDVQRIRGHATLEQRIGRSTFEISPDCFFQNNLLLVDELYAAAAGHIRGRTLDLFCGTGTIGIHAAERAQHVTGVDVSEANIELARRNAERNRAGNVEFVTDKVNHFLAFYDGPVPDTVVLDPPRSGLAPKLIRKLNRLAAPRIVYVSCNPNTFALDIDALERYELRELRGFDMFPQTPHVELVSLLTRD